MLSPLPVAVTWHNTNISGAVRARALRAAERHVARSAQLTLGASDDLGGAGARAGAAATCGSARWAAPVLPEPWGRAQVRKELGVGARGLAELRGAGWTPRRGTTSWSPRRARWRLLDARSFQRSRRSPQGEPRRRTYWETELINALRIVGEGLE